MQAVQRKFPSYDARLVLSDAEYDQLCTMIVEQTGISMGESKRQLVYRRVSGRLKELGLSTFSEYIEFLKTDDPVEREIFINTITTNLTSFYRENHHFEYLAETIIPDLLAKKKIGRDNLRIWSAGCSKGQEPYSLAMTLRESIPAVDQWDLKVLCTDLDTEVLKKGFSGIYTDREVEGIPAEKLAKWFTQSIDQGEEKYIANADLKKLLVFNQLNLMESWPMKGKFDVIFCRNVIIYFDKETQKRLMERFVEYLTPNGYLILGHSESLHGAQDRFKLIGKTIYQKTK